MAIDGEVTFQYIYPLVNPVRTIPALNLPNITLADCCSEFKTQVFGKDGVNINENDFTSFLIMTSASSSAAQFQIYKNVGGNYTLQTVVTNNDYGTLYAYGFEVLGINKYIGYYFEWWKILDSFGEGVYKIVLAVTDSLLGNYTLSSDEYMLCEYTPRRAEGTVRINWFQNGTIGDQKDQRLNFDYLNLNWENQIRLPGWFGFVRAENEEEYVRYTNGLEEWTLSEQTPKYDLMIKNIPFNTRELLRVNVIKSDRATVTDYNTKNDNMWQDFEIKFNTAFTPKYYPMQSKLANVKLECEQRYNNLKKFR